MGVPIWDGTGWPVVRRSICIYGGGYIRYYNIIILIPQLDLLPVEGLIRWMG